MVLNGKFGVVILFNTHLRQLGKSTTSQLFSQFDHCHIGVLRVDSYVPLNEPGNEFVYNVSFGDRQSPTLGFNDSPRRFRRSRKPNGKSEPPAAASNMLSWRAYVRGDDDVSPAPPHAPSTDAGSRWIFSGFGATRVNKPRDRPLAAAAVVDGSVRAPEEPRHRRARTMPTERIAAPAVRGGGGGGVERVLAHRRHTSSRVSIGNLDARSPPPQPSTSLSRPAKKSKNVLWNDNNIVTNIVVAISRSTTGPDCAGLSARVSGQANRSIGTHRRIVTIGVALRFALRYVRRRVTRYADSNGSETGTTRTRRRQQQQSVARRPLWCVRAGTVACRPSRFAVAAKTHYRTRYPRTEPVASRLPSPPNCSDRSVILFGNACGGDRGPDVSPRPCYRVTLRRRVATTCCCILIRRITLRPDHDVRGPQLPSCTCRCAEGFRRVPSGTYTIYRRHKYFDFGRKTPPSLVAKKLNGSTASAFSGSRKAQLDLPEG